MVNKILVILLGLFASFTVLAATTIALNDQRAYPFTVNQQTTEAITLSNVSANTKYTLTFQSATALTFTDFSFSPTIQSANGTTTLTFNTSTSANITFNIQNATTNNADVTAGFTSESVKHSFVTVGRYEGSDLEAVVDSSTQQAREATILVATTVQSAVSSYSGSALEGKVDATAKVAREGAKKLGSVFKKFF